MIFILAKTILLGALLLIAGLFAGCAPTMTAAPEPRIVTVEVPRIVQVRCKDERPPADDYPDTDERIAMIPPGDFEALGKALLAGRNLRADRLTVDDVQIKACAGE